MKTIFALMIPFFISLSAFGQISSPKNPKDLRSSEYFKYRLDSISTYKRDKNSNSWEEVRTSSFLYNNNNQLILFAVSSGSEQIFKYDDNENLISIINHVKGYWDSEKQTYKYNESGQMIQTDKFNKFIKDRPFSHEYTEEFSYTDNGNLETENYYCTFNQTDNKWEHQEKNIYTYNIYDDIVQKIELKLKNDVWDTINIHNYEYLYNTQNNITKKYILHKILNQIKDYSYDQNENIIQEKDWDDHGEKFLNYEINYSYDLSHNICDVIMPPLYIFNDRAYNNFSTSMSIYNFFHLNEINNMITKTHIIKVNGDETKHIFHYSTHEVTAVEDKYTPTATIVFPNPASDYISINTPLKSGMVVFDLFNAQGQKILTSTIDQSEKIDLSGITPGIYFYNLDYEGQVSKGKLIKE